MPTEKTILVYQFDELSDTAKERARNWYREGMTADDFEFVRDDFMRIGEILGIEFETHSVTLYGGGTRQEPNIWWSLSYSQGDGAHFEGWYRYAKGAAKAIREYAPKDERLHRIADTLADVQRRNFYQVTARCKTGRYGGSYVHENMMSVDVERNGVYLCDADGEAVTEALRDLCRWFHNALQEEDLYRNSDEQIDESIRANEYTFDEDGDREDA